jgi:hypothetical protein
MDTDYSLPKKLKNGSGSKASSGRLSAARVSRVADLSSLRILQDRFVFDVRSGTFHRVSETAAFILGKLGRKTPIPKLVGEYAKRYEISRAVAERDVELFLNDLSVAGLPANGAMRTLNEHRNQ